jgi:glucoamylase
MLVTIILFMNLISGILSSLICPDKSSSIGRSDCGYVGITQYDCIMKQCCWQPTDDKSAFCTYPVQIDYSNYYNPYYGETENNSPFTENEINTFFNYFLNNINIQSTGAVTASPDLNTPGGSYFYHWARDGALTMNTLQSFTNETFYKIYFQDYLKWIQIIQSKQDPNGIDIRIEPKYEIPSGYAYNGPWCRPQNDGPGLQAIALINSGLNIIDTWHIIKYNLDYIFYGYNSATCDLWEEIVSNDFFWNKVTMAKALSLGSELAYKMGYKTDAENWLYLSNQIKESIYNLHWNGYYYYESTNRPIDGAVIIGLNNGYDDKDNFLNPLSYEVASTVYYYNLAFSSEYSINFSDMDFYGILYGRYPGDIYAGGNPWIISTAALATLLYRVSYKLNRGEYMSQNTISMWEKVFKVKYIPRNMSDFFRLQGDGLLLRLKHYIKPYNFHMYEQIDKNYGTQISAFDLTWSYAEVLNAIVSRNKLN